MESEPLIYILYYIFFWLFIVSCYFVVYYVNFRLHYSCLLNLLMLVALTLHFYKVDHCKVETKVPEKVNGETEQEEEELDDYDSLVKRFDLLTSKELETFYDCLYENPKAFRGAVRKYGTKMWFPMSTLDIENDELFGKYGMEWEPFDVDEFINDFCRLEQRRLHRERLEAVCILISSLIISAD